MKKDRLILMISSPYGYRYYNISSVFKNILLYFLVFIFSILFFIVVALYSFASEINAIENKYAYVKDNYNVLLDKHDDLSKQILSKQEEALIISDKIEDLESIIGIKNTNYGLKNRVESASITGLQKIFIMKFVPNGYPLHSSNGNVRISSPYGYRIHPITQFREFHTGTDMPSKMGSPVYATADGVVEFANSGWNGGYGNIVKINHSFGFKTYYAHLDSIAVERGEFIKKGQVIAYSGNSGNSSGPHLHYEVRFLGSHINSKNFMDWNMGNFGKIFDKEKNVAWQSLLLTINNLMQQIPTEQRLSHQARNSKES